MTEAELVRIGAVHRFGAEDIGEHFRINANLITAAAAVNEDLVELKNRRLHINGHVFLSAKWARAPHKVTRVALRLFGLTRRNVLGADLTGEIFSGNFAVLMT